jgi:hypothetical protein
VAQTIGSNRIVPGAKIVTPVGDVERDARQERELRHGIVESAMKALQS